jgi:branched-chain amino acid transport system ATP-binding protein
MLEVKDIHSYYGKSHILQGVSLNLKEGELVCLLGRNGVGKTTTLKSIMGLVKPSAGSILFHGKELIGKQPFEVARLGVGYVPEDRRIFRSLTVHENLLMGVKGDGKNDAKKGDWTVDKVYEVLPRLKERRDNKGGHLSGGEQQMLAIGRALMSQPRLLILDEPSMGLAPLLVNQIFQTILDINADGTTLLLVEQNAHLALTIADRAYVLETGAVVLADKAEVLAQDEQVRHAYLGE